MPCKITILDFKRKIRTGPGFESRTSRSLALYYLGQTTVHVSREATGRLAGPGPHWDVRNYYKFVTKE